MAKKKTHPKTPRYESFKLYGKYNLQTIFLCVIFVLIIGIILGIILQNQVVQALAFQ
jgi:hypothetical protein